MMPALIIGGQGALGSVAHKTLEEARGWGEDDDARD